MKIYKKFTLPEGVGNIGFDPEAAYQAGYDAGYDAGYADECARKEEEIPSKRITVIYVDDFPDESYHEGPCEEHNEETDEWYEVPCPWEGKGPYSDEWAQHFYEFETMDEYLDDYMQNKMDHGCNKYVRIADDFEFEGEHYILFQLVTVDGPEPYSSVAFGLMRKSYTYDFLKEKSVAEDHDNLFGSFCPFDHYLAGDGMEYDVSERTEDYLLVDLEYESY